MLAPRADEVPAAREQKSHCVWSLYDQRADDGLWQTGCGQRWNFDSDGTPEDHKQRFCGYCGGILVVVQSAQGVAPAPRNEEAHL